MSFELRSVRALALCLLLSMGSSVIAAELNGQRFEDEVTVGGHPLRLNGLGLRSIFILKAFVAGIYLMQPSHDINEVLTQRGPRRLRLKMLVGMSGARLFKGFAEGMRNNVPEAQLAMLEPRSEMLRGALQAVDATHKGDTLDLDLIEGFTQVFLNGQPKGDPIPGDDFFVALTRGFFGPRPIDRDLKRGMLGG